MGLIPDEKIDKIVDRFKEDLEELGLQYDAEFVMFSGVRDEKGRWQSGTAYRDLK